MVKSKILGDMLTVCSEYLSGKLRFGIFSACVSIRVAGRSIKAMHDFVQFKLCFSPTTIVPYHLAVSFTHPTSFLLPSICPFYIYSNSLTINDHEMAKKSKGFKMKVNGPGELVTLSFTDHRVQSNIRYPKRSSS